MSIRSDAFGRTVLTETDAKKFVNQMTYGRPRASANATMREGVALSRDLRTNGKIRVKLGKS